jgi:hypothetical protein
MKINGSMARMVIRELEKQGQIKRIVHSHAQLIYSASRSSFRRRVSLSDSPRNGSGRVEEGLTSVHLAIWFPHSTILL